jgi:hypothetical protein
MKYLPDTEKINRTMGHLKGQLFNAYLQAIQLFYILYK